jgi:copper transport protein
MTHAGGSLAAGVNRTVRLSLACAFAALAVPAAASAHATLLRTSPANGAVVARAPRAVVVTFDDTVRVGSGNAAVANATSESVLDGAAHARGRVLTIPLRPKLGNGDYSARWSIVSEDGHREQGVIAFAIGAGSASPTSVLTAHASLGWWAAAFRVLFYLGLLTGAGVAVFAARTRDLLRAAQPQLAHLLFFSLLVAFLGASGVVHDAPSGTRNALVLDIALALSIAGAAAAALAPRMPRLLPAAGVCAIALAATPTFSGHALDANQPLWLSIPADLAHVAGAAVWLGGLVALLTIVPRLANRREATRRVSQAAFAAVPVLALGGLLRAVTELNAVHEAWSTSYGRALLVKTALFVPLVALGYVNRTRLLTATEALRRSVRLEIVLLAIIVGTVAVLVQLKPSREARAAAPAPVTSLAPPVLPPRDAVVDAQELGDLGVGVARSPSATLVTLLGPDGTGIDGRTVTVDGTATTSCGAGCYRAGPHDGALQVTVDGDTLTFRVSATAPDATALLARVTHAFRQASSIVFDESLRSSPANGIVTRFTLKAPSGLSYVIRGGAQAIVIGTRRWDRTTPTGRWVETQQSPLQVTQPYWHEPTNAHLVAPGTITFLDRSIPAWFRVTIGAHSRPTVMHMTAASHFMVDRYRSYDAPVTLSPPSR